MGSEDKMMRFQNFCIKWLNVYLAWMPACMQMNHVSSSVHVPWFSHQNGGADICDVIY